MTCGIAPPACRLPPSRGAGSEVCDRPQRVHLGLHRSIDSDRLANEEARVGDGREKPGLLQRYGSARGPRTRKSKTKTHTGR